MVSDTTMGCTLRGGCPTRPLPDANHPMIQIYGTLPGGNMLASKATVSIFSFVAWKKALDNSSQVISVRAVHERWIVEVQDFAE